jgi:hypothetical protein
LQNRGMKLSKHCMPKAALMVPAFVQEVEVGVHAGLVAGASPRLAAPWVTKDRTSGSACDKSLVLLGKEGI